MDDRAATLMLIDGLEGQLVYAVAEIERLRGERSLLVEILSDADDELAGSDGLTPGDVLKIASADEHIHRAQGLLTPTPDDDQDEIDVAALRKTVREDSIDFEAAIATEPLLEKK